MTTRTRLICTLMIATLCLPAIVGAQQPTKNATGKPSATVVREKEFPEPAPAEPVVTAQVEATEAPATTDSPQLVVRTPEAGVLLPVGTALRVRLSKEIGTHAANPGNAFAGVITQDVVVAGRTVISKGAMVNGHVMAVGEPRRFAGHPWVELRPESVTTTQGKTLTITATAVDTSDPHHYGVTDEGRIKGPTYGKGDKIELVALTGSGAVAGAVIAGPVGSLIGAGAGAGFSSGHWYIKRHSMTIPPTLEVIFEISNPVMQSSSGAK